MDVFYASIDPSLCIYVCVAGLGGGLRLERDQQHAQHQADQRAPLGLREDAAEEEAAEERGEEDLGLLHHGEGARVDAVERDEAEHVHGEVYPGGHGHLDRIAQ